MVESGGGNLGAGFRREMEEVTEAESRVVRVKTRKVCPAIVRDATHQPPFRAP